MPSHVRKGDEVVIRSGDYKGATGTVVRVMPRDGRVIVKGPRIPGVTRNLKPTRINPNAGQVTVDRSFHISAVSPAVDGRPCRVRFETRPDGSKVRLAVSRGEVVKELGLVRSSFAKRKKGKSRA